jgi:hypothetical protein
MRSKDWRCRASHSGENALMGSRLHSALAAAALGFFSHAVATVAKNKQFQHPYDNKHFSVVLPVMGPAPGGGSFMNSQLVALVAFVEFIILA